MECLYNETCEPVVWNETAQPTRSAEFECARGVLFGMMFVAPFWIAIIAAIAAI
jgi:hypothetical protein